MRTTAATVTVGDLPDLFAAVCRQVDPETFFPPTGGGNAAVTAEAKKVCLGCPVRAECLEWALENDERFGIWGGHTEHERERLKAGKPIHDTRTCRRCGEEFTIAIGTRGAPPAYCSRECKKAVA